MVFGAIFKKDAPKPEEDEDTDFAQDSAQVAQAVKKQPSDMPDFGSDFENAIDSPEKLLADDVLESPKSVPQTQAKVQAMPQKAVPKPAQQQPEQKIPAFVSLDKYKEIRFSLRDIKLTSAGLRKTLESLRQNRDGGTNLLNNTIDGLERIEGNLDKIRTVLRT